MILGIDVTFNPSGGGRRYLIEILDKFDLSKSGFKRIVIWSTKDFLQEINDAPYIDKKTHYLLNKGYFSRILWIILFRKSSYKNYDLIFSPFGTYTSKHKNYVSMSQNMLPFDYPEIRNFNIIFRVKFFLIRYFQIYSFRKSNGVIFISGNAQKIISNICSFDNNKSRVINFGISSEFYSPPKIQRNISFYSLSKPFNLLYVSSIWPYKHHLAVAKAVVKLRLLGYPIAFTIIGKNDYPEYGDELFSFIKRVDSVSEFIFWHEHIGLNEISNYYKSADGFIFPSTCENMPNILIEAMSAGLPILCSSSQPMPEFLKDAGLFFDSYNEDDIFNKIKFFLENESFRSEVSNKSYELSKFYSWQKCSDETFEFLFQNLV